MDMLAGTNAGPNDKQGEMALGRPSLSSRGVSYKVPGSDRRFRRFKGAVQETNVALTDRPFRLFVIKPLKADGIAEIAV